MSIKTYFLTNLFSPLEMAYLCGFLPFLMKRSKKTLSAFHRER